MPAIVVDRIMLYTDKLKYRKKIDFARMLCRYWSLKREARRGAPLLKRLHLEPWTASAGAKVQTEEDKLMRLDVKSIFPLLMMLLIICTATYSIAPGSGQRQGFDATFLGKRKHKIQAGGDRS